MSFLSAAAAGGINTPDGHGSFARWYQRSLSPALPDPVDDLVEFLPVGFPMSTAASETAAAARALQAAPVARLVSLDAFRGFTMFWLMGGKPFFMPLAALGAPATSFH